MNKDLDIEIKDQEVKRLLNKLQAKMKDLTPVMLRIGQVIVSSIEENFQAGGRYLSKHSWRGGPKHWKPLSDVTIAQREKKGYWPGQILIQRARLASSINTHAGPDFVSVGTNVIYGRTMHMGAKKGEFGVKSFVQKVREHIRRIHEKEATVRAHERRVTLPVPWADIPARPFLVVQTEDLTDIKEIINAYLVAR